MSSLEHNASPSQRLQRYNDSPPLRVGSPRRRWPAAAMLPLLPGRGLLLQQSWSAAVCRPSSGSAHDLAELGVLVLSASLPPSISLLSPLTHRDWR